MADPITTAARQNGIAPALLRALVKQESGGNQGARSPAGAIGETQLMPGTARSLGVNPYNAQQNLQGGAKYLRQQLDRFGGNVRKALAAYNAGPGAVEKYGGVPPFPETQAYVNAILANMGGKAPTGTGGTSQPTTTTTTRTVGAVNHTKARGALIASFLEGADPRLTQGTAAAGQQTTDPLSFVAALKGLADVPGRQVTTTTPGPATAPGAGGGPTNAAGYVNPFAGSLVKGGRIDEGLDPVIKGPIRAVGDAQVEAVRQFSGFGTYVAYRLTSGPQAGKRIYISEGIVPHVKPGQTVKAGQVIATGTGAIETGWAGGPGGSFLPVANRAQGGTYTEGAATGPGRSFNRFLRQLGAHAGP